MRHHQFFGLIRQKILRRAVGNPFTHGFVGTECRPEDITDRRFGIAEQLIARRRDLLSSRARIAL